MDKLLTFELALKNEEIDFRKECRFHPKRRWMFDYVILDDFECSLTYQVAIEIEGGNWSGGRHVRGKGFANDCEKYNAAVLLGWKVLRYTYDQIKDIDRVIGDIRTLT